VNHSDIVGVADVSLKGSGVDPNPARLNRSALHQLLNQMLVEPADPIFAKSLIELDQGRCVRNSIHQRKMAKITPWQSLPDFPLHFFVAQAPAKFQIHHPKINPDCRPGTPQTWIERLFKGLDQLGIGQKFINFCQFFVQFIQRGIDKTVAKTHLLRYGSAHDLALYTIATLRPKKIVTFSVRTS
jgi:hypothetical protein